jgi:lysophospholipase L1-like esterase
MKPFLIFCLILFAGASRSSAKVKFFGASDHHYIYIGRIDFSNVSQPTMWATGTQVRFSFSGPDCMIVVNDQLQYGKDHNYLDIVVDGQYRHIKLTAARNEVSIAKGLAGKRHDVIISKSTEAGIGFISFEGAYCKKLLVPQPLPTRKMEFFGDSITSGMGIDTTVVGCHKGEWYDQTNGYMTYAALTARAFNAQAHITSASGIGLIHSCCDMDIVMPQVYDKVSIRENKIAWDFSKFQPDMVFICLGQNDGIQDSTQFCGEYVQLIRKLRQHYTNATFVLLSSPMADQALAAQTKKYLPAIVAATGERGILTYFFSRQFMHGCDSHPSGSEHKLIAAELISYLRSKGI